MANRPLSPVQYIEEDRGYLTPCWVWQRATNGAGYGRVRVGGRLLLAHRHFYQQRHGEVPPELDHLCEVTLCCNPDHLKPASHAENLRRGKHVKLAGRLDEILVTRRAESAASLAREFGVSGEAVRAVRRGDRWATEGAK